MGEISQEKKYFYQKMIDITRINFLSKEYNSCQMNTILFLSRISDYFPNAKINALKVNNLASRLNSCHKNKIPVLRA